MTQNRGKRSLPLSARTALPMLGRKIENLVNIVLKIHLSVELTENVYMYCIIEEPV